MVVQKLNISTDQYEMIVLSIWAHWCKRYATSLKETQKLSCSNSLFQWWQYELTKLENEFLEDIEPYKDLSSIDTLTVYMRTVNKIHFIYSKPLIQKALKNDKKANHK